MSGNVPFDASKARAWNSLWEQRYAPGYIARDDGKQFPKPAVRPQPVAAPAAEGEDRDPGEPHSASVIRALERQINGGKVLSPRTGAQ